MKEINKKSIIVAVFLIVIGITISFAVLAVINFDFIKLNTERYESKVYETEKSFSNITIKEIYSDIKIYSSSDDVCKVIYNEGERICHTLSVKNDTLIIGMEDNRKWYEYINISFGASPEAEMLIYLPEREYDSLYVKAISGDIFIGSGLEFADAEILNTSGDVSMMSRANTLNLETVSGDISLQSLSGNSLKINTTSGEIELSDISLYELAAATTSGDIELSSVICDCEMMLESVSGDIELDYSDAGSLNIKTVSGSIDGELMTDKYFITDTVSGDVVVPTSDSSAGKCIIKTGSGDVKLTISER